MIYKIFGKRTGKTAEAGRVVNQNMVEMIARMEKEGDDRLLGAKVHEILKHYRPVTDPAERIKVSDIARTLNENGVEITPREVGRVCREVMEMAMSPRTREGFFILGIKPV